MIWTKSAIREARKADLVEITGSGTKRIWRATPSTSSRRSKRRPSSRPWKSSPPQTTTPPRSKIYGKNAAASRNPYGNSAAEFTMAIRHSTACSGTTMSQKLRSDRPMVSQRECHTLPDCVEDTQRRSFRPGLRERQRHADEISALSARICPVPAHKKHRIILGHYGLLPGRSKSSRMSAPIQNGACIVVQVARSATPPGAWRTCCLSLVPA